MFSSMSTKSKTKYVWKSSQLEFGPEPFDGKPLKGKKTHMRFSMYKIRIPPLVNYLRLKFRSLCMEEHPIR